jgi:hypothetical protein
MAETNKSYTAENAGNSRRERREIRDRTQNIEHRTQNTEHRTQNNERLRPFGAIPAVSALIQWHPEIKSERFLQPFQRT